MKRAEWRGQALYIRGLYEANRGVTEPRSLRVGSSLFAFCGCWVGIGRKMRTREVECAHTGVGIEKGKDDVQ